MKALVVEDDETSRTLLCKLLEPHAEVEIAEDGEKALSAFQEAHTAGTPYQLVCLDIMMPNLDGHAVLRGMRQFEDESGITLNEGVKVVMTTSLEDSSNVLGAFAKGCEAYVVKPIEREQLLNELKKLGLLEEQSPTRISSSG